MGDHDGICNVTAETDAGIVQLANDAVVALQEAADNDILQEPHLSQSGNQIGIRMQVSDADIPPQGGIKQG
jgi:hypothetical protein